MVTAIAEPLHQMWVTTSSDCNILVCTYTILRYRLVGNLKLLGHMGNGF